MLKYYYEGKFGKEMPKDLIKGIYWATKAAEQGDSGSQNLLRKFYLEESKKNNQDYEKAIMNLKSATELNVDDFNSKRWKLQLVIRQQHHKLTPRWCVWRCDRVSRKFRFAGHRKLPSIMWREGSPWGHFFAPTEHFYSIMSKDGQWKDR